MPIHRRRFSIDEKTDILQEARVAGITVVLRKHNLSYSVFHRWKEKLEYKTMDHVNPLQSQLQIRLKNLSQENTLLKKIISNQAMLLELKENELLKAR
jgi:putative transposase